MESRLEAAAGAWDCGEIVRFVSCVVMERLQFVVAVVVGLPSFHSCVSIIPLYTRYRYSICCILLILVILKNIHEDLLKRPQFRPTKICFEHSTLTDGPYMDSIINLFEKLNYVFKPVSRTDSTLTLQK